MSHIFLYSCIKGDILCSCSGPSAVNCLSCPNDKHFHENQCLSVCPLGNMPSIVMAVAVKRVLTTAIIAPPLLAVRSVKMVTSCLCAIVYLCQRVSYRWSLLISDTLYYLIFNSVHGVQ